MKEINETDEEIDEGRTSNLIKNNSMISETNSLISDKNKISNLTQEDQKNN